MRRAITYRCPTCPNVVTEFIDHNPQGFEDCEVALTCVVCEERRRERILTSGWVPPRLPSLREMRQQTPGEMANNRLETRTEAPAS